MTDEEKLIVVKLLAEIRKDRAARQGFSFTLANMEKAQAAAEQRRTEATSALDAAIADVEKVIW